jgi:hypothetical protein
VRKTRDTHLNNVKDESNKGVGLRPSACWDRGFESHREHEFFFSCTVFVLSSRSVCDGPIPRPEESYRLWCVSECDQVKINNLDTHCEQEGRRGKDYETKRNESIKHAKMRQ